MANETSCCSSAFIGRSKCNKNAWYHVSRCLVSGLISRHALSLLSCLKTNREVVSDARLCLCHGLRLGRRIVQSRLLSTKIISGRAHAGYTRKWGQGTFLVHLNCAFSQISLVSKGMKTRMSWGSTVVVLTRQPTFLRQICLSGTHESLQFPPYTRVFRAMG